MLHVIDDHTNVRNKNFQRSKSVEDIWYDLTACWESTCACFPNEIRSDQEPGVSSKLFRDISTTHEIQLEFTGLAAHNSMRKIGQAHGA